MENMKKGEQPLSEIGKLDNHLENAINHLADSVSMLCEKLHPVLAPPMLRATQEGVKNPKCVNSRIAEHLKLHLQVVGIIQEQINDINTRLEV